MPLSFIRCPSTGNVKVQEQFSLFCVQFYMEMHRCCPYHVYPRVLYISGDWIYMPCTVNEMMCEDPHGYFE